MRKSLAFAAAIGAITLVGFLPKIILGKVDRYQVVAPQVVSYRPSVRCEGTVYPREGYDLLASRVYRVEERRVSLGDRVEEGQVLAVLSHTGQDPVLYLQTQGSGLSGLGEGGGLSALAQSYGLEAAALLGSADSYEALQAMVGEEEEAEAVEVRAPVSGVVTREIPAPGSVVKAGSAICGVEGREEFFALLSVGEKDAAKLAEGDEVILSGEGVGLVACTGVLTKIYPGTRRELSGAATQNVVDIEVAIQPNGQEIRPGFSVKAQIFTEQERQVLVLPYESVRQDTDNQEYVLVAGQYQLEKRPITTGLEMTDGVEILSGVDLDELVTVPKGGSGGQGRYLLEKEE